MIVGEQPTIRYTGSGDLALRAPETILHSDFDVGIDVWAVGCMVRPLHSSCVRIIVHLRPYVGFRAPGRKTAFPSGSEGDMDSRS